MFLLSGELGGGKTQFVKGLAEGLNIKDNITSPTFTYERIYKGKKLILYHFDLYRSEKVDSDVAKLMQEAFLDPKGVAAIEWAEHAKKIWPDKYYLMKFKWIGDDEREIRIVRH